MMDANLIYCGDCAKMMNGFIQDDSIDLIYLDPPFFSQKNYEVIWGDGYEVRAFEDRWKGGIENYISWMEPKLRECHRVLKQTGSIYLHCDFHASHHLKILMDKVFDFHFISEIIWRRKFQSATITSNTRSYGNNHDVILFYSKSKNYAFNRIAIETEVDPGDYCHDDDGYYKTSPIGNYSDKSIDRMLKEGIAYRTKNDKARKKTYLTTSKHGKLIDSRMVDNIWLDLPNMMHVPKKERLGYPTQKPEALLERIIKASSNLNDIVLDPFCGCGTAIAVAHKLKRRWIGIDVSPTACKLMRTRMTKLGITPKIIGLPKTLEQIKGMQPFEFQNHILQQLVGRASAKRTGDLGIDGHLFDGTPVQVKQSEGIGRNVVDNFHAALLRAKKTKGIIVAFSFGKGSYEEVARLHNEEGIMIELKTVEDIMGESR